MGVVLFNVTEERFMMKTSLFAAAVLTVGLLTSGFAAEQANPQADLRKAIAALDQAAGTEDGLARVIKAVSQTTGLSAETLKQQRDQSGLGYGDLLVANALSRAANKPFAQIVAAAKAGKPWGEIAKEYKISVAAIAGQAQGAADIANPPKTPTKSTHTSGSGRMPTHR